VIIDCTFVCRHVLTFSKPLNSWDSMLQRRPAPPPVGVVRPACLRNASRISPVVAPSVGPLRSFQASVSDSESTPVERPLSPDRRNSGFFSRDAANQRQISPGRRLPPQCLLAPSVVPSTIRPFGSAYTSKGSLGSRREVSLTRDSFPAPPWGLVSAHAHAGSSTNPPSVLSRQSTLRSSWGCSTKPKLASHPPCPGQLVKAVLSHSASSQVFPSAQRALSPMQNGLEDGLRKSPSMLLLATARPSSPVGRAADTLSSTINSRSEVSAGTRSAQMCLTPCTKLPVRRTVSPTHVVPLAGPLPVACTAPRAPLTPCRVPCKDPAVLADLRSPANPLIAASASRCLSPVSRERLKHGIEDEGIRKAEVGGSYSSELAALPIEVSRVPVPVSPAFGYSSLSQLRVSDPVVLPAAVARIPVLLSSATPVTSQVETTPGDGAILPVQGTWGTAPEFSASTSSGSKPPKLPNLTATADALSSSVPGIRECVVGDDMSSPSHVRGDDFASFVVPAPAGTGEPPTTLVMSTAECTCGNVFTVDSEFCRICGVRRPEASGLEAQVYLLRAELSTRTVQLDAVTQELAAARETASRAQEMLAAARLARRPMGASLEEELAETDPTLTMMRNMDAMRQKVTQKAEILKTTV